MGYAVGTGGGPVLARDLNCDDQLDLISLDNFSNTASVLQNAGAGTFGRSQAYRAGAGALSIDDFNEDGSPDLVQTNRVLLNAGNGTFITPDEYDVLNGSAAALAVTELNGDMHPDLALVTRDSEGFALQFVLNQGAAGLQAGKRHSIPSASNSYALVATDLDDDELVDIAIVNGDAGKIDVYSNRGNDALTAPASYPSGEAAYPSIAAGDVNADGRIDLVTTGDDGLQVLMNRGEGQFDMAVSYPAALPGFQNVPVIADLDGDGALDIALLGRHAGEPLSRGIGVLMNQGDGTFAPVVVHATGVDAGALAVADLDGNGTLDIATTGRGLNAHRNPGDGTFPALEKTGDLDSGRVLMARDMDGDGALDLLGTGGTLYRNRGDGTFLEQLAYLGGDYRLAAADFDGDGRVDYVSAGERLTLFRNNGCLP